MNQRYCIGCERLQYTAKRMAAGGTYTGAYTAADASMSCKEGHWKSYLSEYDGGMLDLERAMEHAATCPDFKERK